MARSSVQLMPVTDKPAWLRGYRSEVSRLVTDEARRMYPKAVTFSFDTAAEHVDLDKQTSVVSTPESGGVKTVSCMCTARTHATSCQACYNFHYLSWIHVTPYIDCTTAVHAHAWHMQASAFSFVNSS